MRDFLLFAAMFWCVNQHGHLLDELARAQYGKSVSVEATRKHSSHEPVAVQHAGATGATGITGDIGRGLA